MSAWRQLYLAGKGDWPFHMAEFALNLQESVFKPAAFGQA